MVLFRTFLVFIFGGHFYQQGNVLRTVIVSSLSFICASDLNIFPWTVASIGWPC